MRSPIVLVSLLVLTVASPLGAQPTSALAPADASFGRFSLSVLGIANTIRDAGVRFDTGADARALIDGPLAFAADAIAAWEKRYPADYWIPRDLLALQSVYARMPGDDALRLTKKTVAWLLTDFPRSPEAAKLREAVEDDVPVSAWERFAGLRAPLPAVRP